MADREQCLNLLFKFVGSGDIKEVATAAGTILAYFTTLPSAGAQLAAMDDLRAELDSRCQEAGISGAAEERHVVIEDVIEQARSTLRRAGMKASPFL